MDARFRALPVWGHKETSSFARRSRYTFKATWPQTLNLLQREIEKLDGSSVIIGTFHRPGDIRLDGWPRADARMPTHPGVEISFDSRYGRLTYATDVVATWEGNVRSIALGLEALRAVDRYGVSERGEQYAGWSALPSGIALGDGLPRSRTEAIELIEQYAPVDDDTDSPIKDAIRDALKATHPDTGGDPAAFRRVQAAREILEGAEA